MRHVRLPAAAVLATADSELVPVLLLPDIGSAPVVSVSPAEATLELRQTGQRAEEPLLVIVTSDFATLGARTAPGEAFFIAWRRRLASRPYALGSCPGQKRRARPVGKVISASALTPLNSTSSSDSWHAIPS